jgi:hypothetical protein
MRGSESFDGCCRTHWHKSGRFDDAMRRMKNTRTSMSVAAFTDAVESEVRLVQNSRFDFFRGNPNYLSQLTQVVDGNAPTIG